MSGLLTDDQCRSCYHVHPDGPCRDFEVYPTEPVVAGVPTQGRSPCQCDDYVDLEAESRIVVTLEVDR